MNRLKKELIKRNIIWDAPDYIKYIEDDNESSLVCINNNYLVTAVSSAVLGTILIIRDVKSLNIIAEQNLYPDDFCGFKVNNKWGVSFRETKADLSFLINNI